MNPQGSVAAQPLAPARSGTRRADRWLAARLRRVLDPARVRLRLWDAADAAHPPGGEVGALLVRDRRTLLGLVLNPNSCFGEGYLSGRLEVQGDFATVIDALTRVSGPSRPSLVERLGLWIAPANDLLAARRNIHHHYDLGNDFYRLWLDPELVYTCAYYDDPGAPLEHAQTAKLDLVCRKLDLRPGERVLEAGCGWGSLAFHMARRYGVTVRAFNISTEQIRLARERAAREGLSDRVEFVEDDYRNASGRFDAFVSVGMLEHVGRRSYGALAQTLRRCLRRDTGRGLLHFIGRDRPRPLNAWIRRRIFPGAYAPSLAEVMSLILEPADLSVLDVENLRLHYARTLADWRLRFEASGDAVRGRFGEPFYRAWRLYLAGSEAAFASGWMQLFQLVFAPVGGSTIRWTRAGLYTPPAGEV